MFGFEQSYFRHFFVDRIEILCGCSDIPFCVKLSRLVSMLELLRTMSFVIDDGREIPRPVEAKTR